MKKTLQFTKFFIVVSVIVFFGAVGGNLLTQAWNSRTSAAVAQGAESAPMFRIAAARSANTCEPGKVTICHLPPGNPDNPQTLCVDENAVSAHLAHGDYQGECHPPTATPQPTALPSPTLPPGDTPQPTPTSKPAETPAPTPTVKPGETPLPPLPPTPVPPPAATPQPGETPPTPTPTIRQVDVIAPESQMSQLGKTVYYTFTVVNRGNIADRYRLTLESEHQLQTGPIPAEIDLAPAASATIATFVELPLAGAWQADQLRLTAVSTTDAAVNDSATATTTIPEPQTNVRFAKTADQAIIVPGERVVYTVQYQNIGNTPLQKVVVEDRLPEQLRFEESSLPVQMRDAQTLEFTLQPVLYQQEGGTFTITARVRPEVAPRGKIVNTATLRAEGLPEPVEASAETAIEVPALTIVKTVNRSDAQAGDLLLYTVTVTNNGSGTAQKVNVRDTLPSALRYLPGTSAVNGAVVKDPQFQRNQTLAWELGDLKAGSHFTLKYQAAVAPNAKAGPCQNSASVHAADLTGHPVTAGPVAAKVVIRRTGAKIAAEIQGLVFEDVNGNGRHDAGEPGLPGVEVVLIKELLKQRANADGEFFFGDIAPGEQAVGLYETSLPPGYKLTTDSTVLLTLAEGDRGYAEFGVQSDLADISGRVYYDVNANGKPDPGEPGIGNVQLEIDGKVLFTTDLNGKVTARRFPAGKHAVTLNRETLPAQYKLPESSSTPGVSTVTLKPGETKTAAFGVILKPGALEGQVFEDANRNGLFDPNERGMPAVTIELQNGKTLQATANVRGQYTFGELPPGAYTLRVQSESLPPNYRPTTPLSQAVLLLAGQTQKIAWGLAPISNIEQKPTPTPSLEGKEPTPALTQTPGVTPTMALTKTPAATATPTALEDFCVYVVQKGDSLARLAKQFTGKAANYRQIMAANKMAADTLRLNQPLQIPKNLLLPEYQNCSLQPTPTPTPTPLLLGSAAGRVYYDRNANGRYDQGVDIPIPGVTVNIRSDIKTTVTDANGYYRFDNMEPGAHVVWIDPQTLPEPYRPLDNQPIIKIVVQPGGVAASAVADFIVLKAAIYEQGVVEGRVCLDLNGNGDCEQTEPGIVGVTVYDPPAVTVEVHQINPAGDNTPINNCDSATFRVTITNAGDGNPAVCDATEDALNVNIANSMPAGMSGSPQSSNGNTVPAPCTATGENGVRTFDFTYTATCAAVSGDNTTVVTFEGPAGTTYPAITVKRPYTIYPGAITITKVATQVYHPETGVTDTLSPPVSEPPAHLGDVVTWRMRVTSTGKGAAKNIKVVETLGAGLQFSSGPAGATRQYDRTTHGALQNLAVNAFVDIAVDTTVIGCKDITNTATAYWGCGDAIPGCSVLPLANPVTAQTSVNLIVGHPFLTYAPQALSFPMNYCATAGVTQHVSLPITNTGGVAAKNPALQVAFSPLVMSNLTTSTPGGLVSYSGGQFLIGATQVGSDLFLPALATVTLEFDLTYPANPPTAADWCSGNVSLSGGGTFIWEPTYYDQCNVKYVTPLGVNDWKVTAGTETKPTVSMTKICSFGPLISLGETPQTVTCTIAVTYNYPANCVIDPDTTDLTVTDTYPTAWTAGNISPSSGAAISNYDKIVAGTITWNIPKASLSGSGTHTYVQEFTIPAMGASICPWCGTSWTNSVNVAGKDCCGCNLSANASVSTNIACPGPVTALSSTHTATVASAAVCTTTAPFELTHVYNFTGDGWASIPWTNNITLTDDLPNGLEYVPGSLTLNGSVCTPDAVDSIDAGKLVFTFSNIAGCAFVGKVGQNNNLTVTYKLRPTINSAPQCGVSFPFTDWSTLNVVSIAGVNTGAGTFCPGGPSGGMQEKKPVNLTTQGTAMQVTLTGVEPIVGACGEYDLTLTVTKTSAEPAYDVVLRLVNPNNELLTPTGWTTFEPTNLVAGTKVGNDLVWDYSDLFSGGAGQTATITLHTQKNCVNDLELTAKLGFNNRCTNVLNPLLSDARSCSTQDGPKIGIIRPPDVTITKFPEIIYASGIFGTTGYKPAQWRITVLNSGAGPASHIEVVDTLGSDLTYLSSTWDDNTGITTFPNKLPDNSTVINGVSFLIAKLDPGEERVLTLKADIFGCQLATNDITARVQCQLLGTPLGSGKTCQTMSKHAEVRFPATNLVVTTDFVKEADTCSKKTVTIIAKNTGLTEVTDISLFQIFPTSLQYQSGSATYSLDGGATWLLPLADRPENGDPVPFTWSYTDLVLPALPTDLHNALKKLLPNKEIQIRFDAYVPCQFTGGDLKFYAEFDECGTAAGRVKTAESLFTVIPNKPIVTVTKTTSTPNITCDDVAKWILTVTNAANGTGGQPVTAQFVELRDTLGTGFQGGAFTLKDSLGNDVTSDLTFTRTDTNSDGFLETMTWSLRDMAPNTSKTYTMTAEFKNCTGTLTNTLAGKVGCWDATATPPAPSCYICRYSGEAGSLPFCPEATSTITHEAPQLDITLDTPTLPACAEAQEVKVTLKNTSTRASIYDLDLDFELPLGVRYLANTSKVNGTFVPDTALTFVDNPDPTPDHLIFYDTNAAANNLPTMPPNGTIVITFNVDTDCLTAGNFKATPRYNNCCSQNTCLLTPTPASGCTAELQTTWQHPDLAVTMDVATGPFQCGADVTWTVHVKNTGAIAAEMVRVQDKYGAGLSFVSLGGLPGGATYSHTPPNPPTAPEGIIEWEIADLQPGVTKDYTLVTTLGSGAACNDVASRTNTATAQWSCTTSGGIADQLIATDEARCHTGSTSVSKEASVLPQVNVAATINPSHLPLCAVGTFVDVDITIPNTSNTVYKLAPTITLPAGVTFNNTGAASDLQISVVSGSATHLAAGPMPADSATSFTFDNTSVGGTSGTLADSVAPGTVIRIRMLISSSCISCPAPVPPAPALCNIGIGLAYDDCCQNHYTDTALRPITSGEPKLTTAVTRTPSSDVDCGTEVAYQITVTNTGTEISAYSYVEVAVGSWMTFQAATAPTFGNIVAPYNAAPYQQQSSTESCYQGVFPGSGAGACAVCVLNFSNGTIRWEVKDLPPGGTWSTTLTIRPVQPVGATCALLDRQINVSTHYGCPANITTWAFNSNACSNEDSGTCGANGANTYTDTERQPDLQVLSVTPTISCANGAPSGSLQVVIANFGDGATLPASFQLKITEPSKPLWSNTYTYTGSLAAAPVPQVTPTTATVTIPLDFTGLTADCSQCQTYAFTVAVDSAAAVCECNEGNNLSTPTNYSACAAIGDLVWHDINGDGIQNDGVGTGISGVRVYLLDQNGNRVKDSSNNDLFKLTDASGNYLFDHLLPGNYGLEFDKSTLPAGYIISPPNAPLSTTATDSDADRTTGKTAITTLSPGETDLTWDMGIFHPVSVGDRIWIDADADGIQDSGELDLQGAVVELYLADGVTKAKDITGTDVLSVTTGTGGLYAFTNLPPGDYVVRVTPPTGYTLTKGGADPDNNDNTDSNGYTTTTGMIQSYPITLTSGGETGDGDADANNNPSVDFGFYQPASLGDFVWFDKNANGIQDTGETGIPGVTVTLTGTDGAGNSVTRTTTTGTNGDYLFANLMPGNYSVTFTPPTGYVFSPKDQGSDDAKDSDANPNAGVTFGQTVQTTLVSGENDLTWDAGLYQPVRIGNLVWHDANDNGIYEPLLGESGLDGVTVTLTGTDGAGNAVSLTTTTSSGGKYLFDNLAPGAYTVSILTPPTGYPASSDVTDMADNGQDNDDNGSQATVGGATTSPVITLTSQQEPPAGTDTDDWNGDLTIDFGFYAPVNIGNLVWHDLNNDGQYDADGKDNIAGNADDETGIQGVEVYLQDASGNPVTDVYGNPVGPQTTGANGKYLFSNLRPGQYVVVIPTPPAAYPTSSLPAVTDTNDNGQDDDDNGIQATSGGPAQSPIITLTSNGEVTNDGDGNNGDLTVDFGFFHPVSVGNRVWFDIDADGVQDADESGIPGVTVQLLYNDGGTWIPAKDITGTTLPDNASLPTDSQGLYNFTNLPPGDYRVVVPKSNWTSGVFSPTGAYANALGSPNTTDSAGDNGNDADDNGDQDGENAWNGVQSPIINLQSWAEINDGDGDANNNPSVDFGFYRYDFGDLPDSYGTLVGSNGARHALDGETYLGSRVDEELTGVPTDTALGDDNDGRTDDEDGVKFLTPIMPGKVCQIQVTASQAGYLNVWIDFDGDGVLDKLTLTNTATGATVTDNLALNGGTQILEFTAPNMPEMLATTLYSRFRFTKAATDGGVTPDGLAHSGEVEDYALGSLGSRLWRDNGQGGGGNNNGKQDGTEPGLSGATVQLYKQGQTPGVDAPLATTTTNAQGDYRFTGLPEDTYVVYLPPSNFKTGGALENLYSSSDPLSGANNPNTGQPGFGRDQQQDENGVDDDYPYVNGIRSLPVQLLLGTEPTGEDGDANSDLTLDFGFIRLDFGDLPDAPYSTSMAHNGPRHVLDDVTFLGKSVDAESDGKPTAPALGDDLVFEDDEDGVTFLTPIMPGQPYTIQVTASVPGYLNAWLDFNGNGTFDAGERISSPDQFLKAGVNTLTLTAPASATPFATTLYSRFRFTSGTGQATTPEGEALNGEVEDYALLSLGNLVWFDDGSGGGAAGDGKRNGTEPPAPGVKMELYRAGQTPGVDQPIATTTTDSNGHYLFTGLLPDNYIVHIPASEFQPGRPLANAMSSFGAGEPNADLDQENDENGIDQPNPRLTGMSSGVIVLALGAEPISEDGDANSNLTIDFGFHELVSLGNRVWFDPDNDGLHQAEEKGIGDVEVRLYNRQGKIVRNYDQVPGITKTDANGYYLFDRLLPGYYIVVIPDPNFAASAPLNGLANSTPTLTDPNENSDRADHGLVFGDESLTAALYKVGPLSAEDLLAQADILAMMQAGQLVFDPQIPALIQTPAPLPIPAPSSFALTVTTTGTGTGTVTSDLGGIACPGACNVTYSGGATVTLTAAAGSGAIFTQWTSGPCSGSTTATCAVTITANTAAAAQFDLPPCGSPVTNGGYCWYLGAAGTSCATTCSGHAAVAVAETFTPGSTTNCDSVLTALSAGSGSAGTGAGTNGCYWDTVGSNRILDSTNNLNSSSANIQRACACSF